MASTPCNPRLEALTAAGGCACLLEVLLLRLSLQGWFCRFAGTPGGATKPTDTLVVYVYSNTDPEYEGNLIYFLEKGVAANDGCDYVIIIQEVGHNTPMRHASAVLWRRELSKREDWIVIDMVNCMMSWTSAYLPCGRGRLPYQQPPPMAYKRLDNKHCL